MNVRGKDLRLLIREALQTGQVIEAVDRDGVLARLDLKEI